MRPTDIMFGSIKRQITCVVIDPLDKFAFFGTRTGDIIEVDLINAVYKRIGPLKRLFSQGVSTLKILPNNDLLVGTGDGLIAKIGFTDFKVKRLVISNF